MVFEITINQKCRQPLPAGRSSHLLFNQTDGPLQSHRTENHHGKYPTHPEMIRSSPKKESDVGETRRKSWSQRVSESSNALDLEPGVFALDDPRKIALSLQRSAESSRRRKAEPFVSAMSMLNFYINRAGRRLPAERRRCLEAVKDELRRLYGKSPRSPAGGGGP